MFAESALAALPTAQANALRIDLGIVEERIKQGITAHRTKAMDKHWSRWDAFYVAHNVDPYLKTWADPIPILQVFGEIYRDGRLGPHTKNRQSSHCGRRPLRCFPGARPIAPPRTLARIPMGAYTFVFNIRSRCIRKRIALSAG
jgi:hypothetical protein